jgi:hypothetical protein
MTLEEMQQKAKPVSFLRKPEEVQVINVRDFVEAFYSIGKSPTSDSPFNGSISWNPGSETWYVAGRAYKAGRA